MKRKETTSKETVLPQDKLKKDLKMEVSLKRIEEGKEAWKDKRKKKF